MKTKNRELKIIFMVTGALFALFLVYPTVRLLLKSILSENGMTMEFYHSVLTQKGFLKALGNSFLIAGVSALLTTGLAFFLAYTIHYTNINAKFKEGIEKAAVLPMFLPTLTYGFAIIYSFGKQGLLTKLFNKPAMPAKVNTGRIKSTSKLFIRIAILK